MGVLRNRMETDMRSRNLRPATVDVIRRGGDTDTNAAIVGAMLGAAQGAGGDSASAARAASDLPGGFGVAGSSDDEAACRADRRRIHENSEAAATGARSGDHRGPACRPCLHECSVRHCVRAKTGRQWVL